MNTTTRRRLPLIMFAGALVVAGSLAFMHEESLASPPQSTASTVSTGQAPPLEPMENQEPSGGTDLPPGHPSIASTVSTMGDGIQPANDDVPALTWTAPSGWMSAPNTSKMRLATFRVPRAPSDSDNAELSIVRAGGSTDANIQRWREQFDDATRDVRATKVVRGLAIDVVEIRGTFLGGNMMGGAPVEHKGWSLLAAIVATPGTPYFFKLTGPTATVNAARPAFEKLLEGVAPPPARL